MTDLFAVSNSRDLIEVLIVLHDPDRHLSLGGRTIAGSPLLIRIARNLEEARFALNARRPDLVLASANLSDGRATDLLDATGLASGCPLVVVTEPGEAALADRACAAGALDHLPRAALTAQTLQEICVRSIRLWHAIQAREKAERALQALQLRHERTLETALDGYLVLDAFGTLRQASDPYLALTGFQRDELEGARLSDFVESPAALEQALKLCVLGGSARLEIRHRTDDGGALDLDLRLTCLEQPRQRRITGFIQDFTETRRAEAGLRLNQERLRTILESQPECVKTVDREGRLLDINPAGLRFVEAESLEQVRGCSLYDIIHPAHHHGFRTLNERVFEGATETLEFEIVGLRGTRRWMQTTGAPMRDADGNVVAHLAVTRDISLRRRLERELEERERLYRVLYKDSPVMLLAVDSDTRIEVTSDHWLQAMGYEREEVLGKRAMDFLADDSRQFLRDELLAEFRRTGFCKDIPLNFVRRDGSIIKTLMTSRAISEDNRIVRSLSVLLDVTERDEAERALRESEHRFEALFNQVHNFIGVLTPAGEFIDINEGSLRKSGIRREDVVGRFLWETPWWVDVPDEREKALLAFEQVRRGKSVRDETSFRQSEGSLGQAVRSFKPLFDADGEVTSVILEGHDITDRLDAEQKIHDYAQRLQVLSQQLLETQENERRHIARELHDEIGQALTALKLNLHAASERGAGDGEHPYFDDSADIIERLLGQVRALSLDLRPSMLDDLGLGAALRWYCGRQGQRSGIDFSVSLDPRIERLHPEVETACYRIAQEAVTNVVKHACGSRAEIRVAIRNDELELIVADDGIGFDVAERQNRAMEGTSFGLVGMQERALLVGGEFQVESSPGQSATIRARFPIH